MKIKSKKKPKLKQLRFKRINYKTGLLTLLYFVIVLTPFILMTIFLSGGSLGNVDFYFTAKKVSTLNIVLGSGDTAAAINPIYEGYLKNRIWDRVGRQAIEKISNPTLRDKIIKSNETFKLEIIDNASDIKIQEYDNISLGLAKRITSNKNHKEFVVYLKPNLKYSNGKPILAQHFAFGTFIHMVKSFGSASLYQLNDYSNFGEDYTACLEQQTDKTFNSINEIWMLPPCQKFLNSRNHPQYGDTAAIAYDNEKGTITYRTTTPTVYLPTLFTNPVFFPIDDVWWNQKVGMNIFRFSINKDSILESGPFKIAQYNQSYGIVFEKNQHYHDADTVFSNRWVYRYIEDPSTMAILFANGTSSFGNLTGPVGDNIRKNNNLNKYIQTNISYAQTQLITFNLSSLYTESENKNSVYMKDVNFRRAINFAYNRKEFLDFEGKKNTLPATSFTNARLGKFPDPAYPNDPTKTKDLFDMFSKQVYKMQTDNGPATMQLEYYNFQDKLNALKRNATVDNTDKLQNREVANHYWKKFIDKHKPSLPITLNFLTLNSNVDNVYKSLTSSINKILGPNKIVFKPLQRTTASFWATFYNTNDWDLASIRWSPDFTDPWGFLSLFSKVNKKRKGNSTASWNYVFGANSPSVKESDRTDGIFYILNNTEELENLIPANNYFGLQKSDLEGIKDLFVYYDQNDPDPFRRGNVKLIDFNKLFAKTPLERAKVYVIFELLLATLAPVIKVQQERVFESGNRSFFITDPVIGKRNFHSAYDCRSAKNLVKGLPSCNDLIEILDKQ